MKKLQQLVHPGPIIALGTIAIVSIFAQLLILEEHSYGFYSLTEEETGGTRKSTPFNAILAYCAFMFWPIVTLYNYFRATFDGPGFVPLGWRPRYPEYQQYLQYCDTCFGFKPPRAHHCQICQRCIHKMDHHCPWINGCTGAKNQAHFIYFLFFAPIGCIHALAYHVPFLYRLVFSRWYYKNDYTVFLQLTRYPIWFFLTSFLSTGLAMGVIIAVGMLLQLQIRQAMANQSGIEGFIVKKAASIRQRQEQDIGEGFLTITEADRYPEFVFPYNLSWKRNLKEILVKGWQDDGDYCNWPLKNGCSQFDLTVEQMRQKKAKRDNASSYEVTKPYNGIWCPVFGSGWRTACPPPMLGEARLKVKPGEMLQVTRGRGSWLYGELIYSPSGIASEDGRRQRGWIPKDCARRISEEKANAISRNKFE